MAQKNKKVLLQIIDSLYRGGAQKVVVDNTRLFPEFDHIVCYWADEEDFLEDLLGNGVKVFKIPFFNMLSLVKTINYVRKLVKEHKVEVIHAHMFTPNLIARLIKIEGIKVVSTYHGEVFPNNDLRTWCMKQVEKRMFSISDVNIAVSDYVRTDLQQKLGVDADKVAVVHNFAETNNLISYEIVNYLDSPLRLIATSNNHSYKNYPLLIKAVSAFSESEITLDIFGSNMQPLKDYVNEKGITNIKFKGSINNLPEVLPTYHIYTATSSSGEGFSLSLLEALNAGMVVLCSDIPQFVEAVGSDGFTFKSNYEEDYIKKLKEILANRQKLTGIAKLAKIRAQLFSKDVFVKKMLELYSR